jgi:hypothetical protein
MGEEVLSGQPMTWCPYSWLGGHRFEARYDYLDSALRSNLSIRRVYVCTRCGAVLERKESGT